MCKYSITFSFSCLIAPYIFESILYNDIIIILSFEMNLKYNYIGKTHEDSCNFCFDVRTENTCKCKSNKTIKT